MSDEPELLTLEAEVIEAAKPAYVHPDGMTCGKCVHAARLHYYRPDWLYCRKTKDRKKKREEIRTRAANGESQRKLAEEFGVSRPTITRLVNGTTWRVDQ